jgi:pyruvate dehydrogenase E2 component (dihydrolipoamide acetyltransferase)
MTYTVQMPRYGATMEEGTVAFWAVKIGDLITKGDVLAEIESEKLTNELRAEESGVVVEILAEVGVAYACGTPILVLGQLDEDLPSKNKETVIFKTISKVFENSTSAKIDAVIGLQDQNTFSGITPKALQLAKELNIDFSSIVGTGRNNLITREDIRNYLEGKDLPIKIQDGQTQQPSMTLKKMSRMQISILNTLKKSISETIQTTISMDMDASGLVQYRQHYKNEVTSKGKLPSITAIFVYIVARAMVDHPLLRTTLQGENLITQNDINIGIAVDVQDGLVVPNIKNADKKNINEISAELRLLVQKTQQNQLKSNDVSDGSFTISNLGMYGIKYFNPILNPGESGILGIGALQNVTQIKENGIFITPIIPLNLTYDHSIFNGVSAAKFLHTVQVLANNLISE